VPTKTFYANTQFLPRELRGEPATGETCHHERAIAGEGCDACAAESVASRGRAPWTDLLVREFSPLTDSELSEIVYGYITAATWLSLDKPCDRCEGFGVCKDPADNEEGACADCHGSGGTGETGSDPYEYGPDDLDTDSAARVREIVSSFVGEPGHWSFATTADIRLYEEIVGGMIDHPQAAGGTQLGARDVSALERIGHTLYLTASGSGVSFTDDEWPERDDVPRERREYNGMLRRLARAASGHGLDSVMLCTDGTIQVQG
jgi:hypothetical protein